jgi:hypothetical protein
MPPHSLAVVTQGLNDDNGPKGMHSDDSPGGACSGISGPAGASASHGPGRHEWLEARVAAVVTTAKAMMAPSNGHVRCEL